MVFDFLLAAALVALVIVPPLLSTGGWVICQRCDKDGMIRTRSGCRMQCPACRGQKGYRR